MVAECCCVVAVLTELHSSWMSDEVLLNALAAVNNLTFFTTGDSLWEQHAVRLGEGEWTSLHGGGEGRGMYIGSQCDNSNK